MKFQWVSAAVYNERLNTSLWRKVLRAYAISCLPLILFMPKLISLCWLAGFFLKYFFIGKNNQKICLLGILLIIIFAALIIIPNVREYGITVSLISLLALMSVAKILESRNSRDVRIIFLIGLFLQIGVLMFDQQVITFLYSLFAIAVNFRMLAQIHGRSSLVNNIAKPKDIAKILVLALPFTALLFFVTPRVSPIWGLQRNMGIGTTGLPNEMTMDGISELVKSTEIAFRVKFNSSIPPNNKLYWRGPVLWVFDGTVWHNRGRKDWSASRERVNFDPKKTKIALYTITPNNNRTSFLPVLDIPRKIPDNLFVGSARQVYRPPVVRGEQRYHITSVLDYSLQPYRLSLEDRTDALQLPNGYDYPKTKKLAEQMYKLGGDTVNGFASEFMKYIAQEEFYYTLKPFEGAEDVEQFLFSSRGGFCQHYANAMAISARLVGIPARVIIGYQGGAINSISGDFSVRQENAHAWVELWDEENGWKRYDPTSAVAPNRINDSSLSAETLADGGNSLSWSARYAKKYQIIKFIREAYDASQAFWQNWIINFNEDRQYQLFSNMEKFGISRKMAQYSLLLVFIAALIALWFLWQRQKKNHIYLDKLALSIAKKLKYFNKKGLIKPASESFADFLRRQATCNKFNDNLLALNIANEYENLRYHKFNDDKIAFMSKLINNIRKLSLK